MWPLIWGTLCHDLLLMFASEYPNEPTEEDKLEMGQWIYYCYRRLPCPGCKKHACLYLKHFPVKLDSKRELLEWIVTMRNVGNRRNGKRSSWTVEEALEALKQRYQKDMDAMDRANMNRIEDHKKINELEIELYKLRRQLKRCAEPPKEEVVPMDLESSGVEEETDEIHHDIELHIDSCPTKGIVFKEEMWCQTTLFCLMLFAFLLILILWCLCLLFKHL